MASDSRSAVLELTDGDADDADATSVTDDAVDGAPLIMEHGYDIAVKVDAPLKQLSTLETYVTYRVRCVCARWPTPPYVRRRYNHFKALHKRLAASHPLVAIPPLPPLHSARQQLDRYSPSFVALRTLALHAFLDRVAKHPLLSHSDDFRLFLTTPDDELDRVFKSENSALNLWGISSAFYANSSDKPTNGARVKDPEFTAAAEYLQSLQQKLTTLCQLTTKLYKGGAALGAELMGMSRVCSTWSCQSPAWWARAAAAAGGGAAAAGRALLHPPVPRHTPRSHEAQLQELAAYCGAHVAKIRQRDAVHAAHVSSGASGEIHNRLEQASEAIRSDLDDWTPKTRREIKGLLLEMADRQVSTLTQMVMGWENALKMSTETNVEDLFKTVSKSAVQNLSPSKSKADDMTPTETERDFDDLDNYSDDFQELRSLDDANKVIDETNYAFNKVGLNEYLVGDNSAETSTSDVKIDVIGGKIKLNDGISEKINNGEAKTELDDDSSSKINKSYSGEDFVRIDSSKSNGDSKCSSDSRLVFSKISDPLQEFSDIDLTS